MTVDELKPCPFCGGEADVMLVQPVCVSMPEYVVVCSECGAKTGYSLTKAEAIAEWNTRVERTCKVDSLRVTNEDCCGYDVIELSCGHMVLWLDGDQLAYCPFCGAKSGGRMKQYNHDPLTTFFAALILVAVTLGLVYIVVRLAFALVGLFV